MRPDGFHDIESLFASLALSDTLRFEPAGTKGESRLSVNREFPDGETGKNEQIAARLEKDNLVLRAVSLFRERTGFAQGLKIHLDKRIPLEAGLGGGSSDAASTLLALNALSARGLLGPETVLTLPELREMAASLGSDVPFFLDKENGGAAYVSGRGELVEKVHLPRGLWVVLVKPPFSSSTATAFALLDRAREQGTAGPFNRTISKEIIIRSLEDNPEIWPFYNDFLPVFLNSNTTPNAMAQAAAYRSILKTLKDFGASFAGLSGAGSCCFGIFKKKDEAERAVQDFSGEGNFVKLTFFLAHKADSVLE